MHEKTWVTKLYEWIHGWDIPWLNKFLEMILHDVIYPVLKKFTEDELNFLEAMVLTEAAKDIPGPEKAQNVLTAFRNRYTTALLTGISDSMINLVIEIFVRKIKAQQIKKS